MSKCSEAMLGILAVCLVACSPPAAERVVVTATAVPNSAATIPVPPTLVPTSDPFFQSDGGGEPRSGAYWLVWNSCSEGNQAGVAAANGGREAGWIILDDLLEDPGILLGELPVETCEHGVRLLSQIDTAGQVRPDDAAYDLATQLFAAQLNLAAGAEYCPAVDGAVKGGQLLIISLAFEGSGKYLGPEDASEDTDLARSLAGRLARYNVGDLCR